MQKSADIAVQAHRMAKEIISPGIYEYEVEAKLNEVFRAKGSSGWAYPAIVASGKNSCVLHYTQNNEKIKKDDLILIDAGAEYEMYASDITRVHAATGSMTKEQQDVYDVVLEAQLKAIETIKTGNDFQETNNLVTQVIGEGLKNLGYIKDKNVELIRESAAIVVSGLGKGRTICLVDNPNFRAFWYGTNQIFTNSVFFGSIISQHSVEKASGQSTEVEK